MAQITIPLFYDLDLLLWTSAVGGIARQPNLVLGQSDSIAFAVQFVRSGVVIELTSPQFICGIKPINDVAGDYLSQTTTGVKTGSTTTTVYTFTLLLDSTELRAWLLTVTAVSNYAAFSIRDTVNLIATLPAITCTILPDYTLEGTTPTAASGILIVASGQTFTVNKTYSMPADDGTDGFVLKTNGAGVGSWVANTAGAVTSVAQTFTGGIVSVGGSPITTSGTLALTVAGTSGGIPYFSSTSTWASTGGLSQGGLILGGGTGSPTALLAVASGGVLTSAGTNTSPAYSSTITLGASGTLGTITLGNATSGTILITPPTGALGTVTLTLPITSTTLAGLAVTQSFTAVNTFSSATPSTTIGSGAVVISAGGLGVFGSAYIGGVINLPATTATAGQITQAGSRLFHTIATENLFLGIDSGNLALVTGDSGNNGKRNIGIGKNALLAVTTGSGNVAIGRAALLETTSGASNLCIGDAVGFQINTGNNNIGIGSSSLNTLTTGSQNTAIGNSSLGTVSITSNNTAIGFQSLGLNTASNNAAIGHNSGYSSTSSSGVYIGQSAGFGASTIGGLLSQSITSGANCTMLGQGSGSTLATGNYRTAIGSDSRCQNNNAIKLGRDENDVVILPSMTTTQRNAYATPVGGSLIFNVTTGKLNFYNSTAAIPAWEAVTSI